MEYIINYIVNHMLAYELIESSKKDLYIYHLTIMIEKIVAYLVILFLAIKFEVLVQTILFLFFFANIRKYSGGFHLRRFYSCFISSVGLYVFFVKGIYPLFDKSKEVLVLALFVALIIILCIGAVNNENIDWSIKELRESRQIARYMGTIEVIIIIILELMNLEKSYLIYMTFGVLLSAILLLMEKIRRRED